MDYEIKKFDALTATAEEWSKYHTFRKKRHMELTPDDPINPNEMIEIARKQEIEDDLSYSERYFVYNNSEIIGSLVMVVLTEQNPSYKGNENLCQFDMSILPEFRRNGLGTKLFQKIISFSEFNKKTILLTNTSEESGKNFLKKVGFSLALAGKQNRLLFSDINWEMMQHWVDEGRKRNPESKMMFFDSVPEDLIIPYSKVYTETMNQQPFGELEISDLITTPELLRKREKEFAELSIIPVTAITIESNGDISGLTEFFYNSNTGEILQQGLTGVKNEYRGRGLGKWLKAALIIKIKEIYPEIKIVKTGNAESNAPMLSINERMGFKVFKEDIMCQITVEKVKEKLEDLRTVESMLSA